jgi:transcriptional regulator with XRE-family HTH domain
MLMSTDVYGAGPGELESTRMIFGVVAKALSQSQDTESFGARLRHFRSARALTQEELGHKVGLSQRMIAYYEVQNGTPSAPLVAKFAAVLGVSVDELLGVQAARSVAGAATKEAPRTAAELRLWRKLQELQKLPPQKRRAVLQVLDGFLTANSKAVGR